MTNIIERPFVRGLTNKIDRYPNEVVARKFGNINSLIETHHLTGMAIFILEKEHCRLKTVFENCDTRGILSGKPAIVIYNHPFIIEPLILTASLPPRITDDIFFPATRDLPGRFGEKFDEHLIPVHLVASKETNNSILRFWRNLHPPPRGKNVIQAQKLNQEAFGEILEKVQRGGLVCIAPEGGRGDNGEWDEGVGMLVKSLGRKANNDAYIVFAHIEGTSWRVLYRFFTGLPLSLNRFTTTFSCGYRLADIYAGLNREGRSKRYEITAYLQQRYQEFCGVIER